MLTAGTMSSGPTIKVHSDSNLVFACMKPCVDSGCGKTATLVSSLREAQSQVNQFLTELVVKSSSQGQNQALEQEVSNDEDEDEDDGEPNINRTTSKRKNDGNSRNGSSNGTPEKRVK